MSEIEFRPYFSPLTGKNTKIKKTYASQVYGQVDILWTYEGTIIKICFFMFLA